MQLEQTRAGFQTTHWTLLGRLQRGDDAERAAAMDSIIRTYWPAVYASLRRSGRSRDEAAELTQAFFAEVALGRGLFDRADQARGRLRTLILTALKRFTVDQHRRKSADPGRNGVALEDLEREDAIIAAVPAPDPDAAFDRRWALALFNEALDRCERHFREGHRARNWDAFAARIITPAMGHCPPVPLSRIAEEVGFATSADAAAAIQTVKKRVLAVLHEVAAETTHDRSEAEAEYEQIVGLLS